MKRSWQTMIAFVMAVAAVSGCALSEGEATEATDTSELATTAFTLHLGTEVAPQNQVVVSSSDGTPDRRCIGGCLFAYLAGAKLSLRVPFPTDRPNCVAFSGWTGACAGQGNPCSLVLSNDLGAEAIWTPIRGCQPL